MTHQEGPPHDAEAEKCVLGAMLLSVTAIVEVSDIVSAADFYKPAHEQIFTAILDLYRRGDPADAVTVSAELARHGELTRIGGAPYLHTLMGAVMTAANAGYHAEIVRDRAIRRRAMQEARSFHDALDPAKTQPEDLEAVLAKYADTLAALIPTSSRARETGPHLAQIPRYPVEQIPDPLGELVRQGRRAGLQPSLVGGSGLGALGTVAGTALVHVYPHGAWREWSALWVPNIAPPGAGKSPAMEFAYRLLMGLDAEARSEYIDELTAWRAGGGEGDRPHDRTRLQEDLTTEMVVRWLAAGDGVGGIAPDELVNFLSSLGKYRSGGNDGGDRARWLSNWALKQWPYSRVTGMVNILVRRPVVSICGGLQPALHHLLGPEDDGFRARWLPHTAVLDTTLKPTFEDASTPLWDRAIERLYAERDPREWTLDAPDGAAFKIWSQARDRWKRQAADSSESATTTGALSKADIQAARIALALAEGARAMDEDRDIDPSQHLSIPEDCMHGAVAIVDYTLDCWRTLPGRTALTLSRREETLNEAVDQLAAWLESHGGAADKRTLLRGAVAGVRKASALDALLSEYEAIYPGSVAQERTGKRGRPATVVHAPRRGPRHVSPSPSPDEIVSADNFVGAPTASGSGEIPAHSLGDAGTESVSTADISIADKSVLTNSSGPESPDAEGKVRC